MSRPRQRTKDVDAITSGPWMIERTSIGKARLLRMRGHGWHEVARDLAVPVGRALTAEDLSAAVLDLGPSAAAR